jgi:hypothetical protein
MARNDKTVAFDNAKVSKMTDLALLVSIDDGEEMWIPKSQVSPDSEVFDDGENSSGKLVITEWIATQKGLV